MSEMNMEKRVASTSTVNCFSSKILALYANTCRGSSVARERESEKEMERERGERWRGEREREIDGVYLLSIWSRERDSPLRQEGVCLLYEKKGETHSIRCREGVCLLSIEKREIVSSSCKTSLSSLLNKTDTLYCKE